MLNRITKIAYPLSAKCTTVLAPIPEAPPVTSAHFPFRTVVSRFYKINNTYHNVTIGVTQIGYEETMLKFI